MEQADPWTLRRAPVAEALEDADGRDFDAQSEFDPRDSEPRPFTPPNRKRVLMVACVLTVLLLAGVLPPLISVNRYRRQIAGSISASLGRPVHMDSVTLNLLPLPSVTLANFVVSEDPAFGSEPVIRADSVRARIRVRSLWRRRVEFARITLEDPSVNLVHLADGRWNIESILLQASRIEAAPTMQKGGGDAPRFPYIEATGARVNVKMGLEKMPVSLTEADFALWLPQPQQWRLRLEGRPTRTDAAAMDTGTLRVQGSLGKATLLKEVPIDLTADWRVAPLGAVSWVLMGRDAGLRGEMNLHVSATGTVGNNLLESRLALSNVRQAEFVPVQPLAVDVECKAAVGRLFHQLQAVRCTSPVNPEINSLIFTGEVPEVLDPWGATGTVKLKNVPAQGLLAALRLASARVAPQLTAAGKISGSFTLPGSAPATGSVVISDAQLAVGDGPVFIDGEVAAELAANQLTVRPIGLKLGAPAPASLDGRITAAGYTMHLSGSAMLPVLMQLAKALPQFGDGLAEALPGDADEDDPVRVDLASSRTWSGGQTWAAVSPPKPAGRRTRKRR